ncbi:MAG: sensor histidine kinase [Armatimonadota bacterium]
MRSGQSSPQEGACLDTLRAEIQQLLYRLVEEQLVKPVPEDTPVEEQLRLVQEGIVRLEEGQQNLLLFVHTITHDLRTPMTTIQGHAQLLAQALQSTNDGHIRRNLEAILRGVRQMHMLVEDLTDLARLEGGRLVLTSEAVKLDTFILDLLQRSRTALEIGRVTVQMPSKLPPVLADTDRLERILLNLLGNALKYSAPDTRVVVRVAQSDSEVTVSIADRGPGIPPEDITRIFEQFYRGVGDRRTVGTGLGLFISKALVEAHGGRIWAESEVGQGSTFHFSLLVTAEMPNARYEGPGDQ